MSEEVLPAGIFINSIREIIVKLRSANLDQQLVHGAVSSCLTVLSSTKHSVFSALGTQTTTELSAWEDPRPTVFEAWLLAMSELINICFEVGCHDNQHLKQLGSETLALCIQILMSKRVEKEKVVPGQMECLSLDGPQTLAMVDFFERSIQVFGYTIFSETATLLHDQMQLEVLPSGTNDPSLIGGGIITASIYRAASGAVPPWAIEYVPSILKSLFHACGERDPFLAILFTGAEISLKEGHSYGVISGSKLGGYYYDTLKPKAKEEFIKKAQEICACDDNTKWRKLKALVKAVCGEYLLSSESINNYYV